ncbi:N-acetyltransferase [Halobacillus sp. Marseille-Q1614]|uniref:GNAT family N-acetyltransferase n=1 Tax=Halobacillus sp. Marseille-Q1614 TaxID=2709134 RepID=UPI00157058E7|nr:GNAT family N-acetyltransferase [Halobacillus sp. Marseille-Q1614]
MSLSTLENAGVGTALIEKVKEHCGDCQRVWLITTNDNLNALKFYQKRGFQLRFIHRNAVEKAREIKPEIP